MTMVVLTIATVALRLTTPWDGLRWSQVEAYAAAGGVAVVPAVAESAISSDDRVLSVDSVHIADLRRGPFDLRPLPPDGVLEYAVASGERTRIVEQRLVAFAGALLLAEWPALVTMAAWLAIAIHVFRRRPNDPAAQVMLITGAAFLPGIFWSWNGVSDIFVGPMVALAAVYQPAYFLGIVATVAFAAVFPRLWPWAARHRRPLLAVAALPIGATALVLIDAQLSARPLLAWIGWLGAIETGVYVGGALTLAVLLPIRYRSLTDAADRQRLVLVVGTIAAATAAIFAVWIGPTFVWGEPLIPLELMGLIGLPIPIALAVAILRYNAFDLQLMVNRSLVYGGATAAIALIYVVVVAAAVLVVHERFGFAVALLATGMVILIAQPLRDGLQRAVNRLMYGDRDDPYQGIVALKERLEASLRPDQVPRVVVDAIATSLRLPYVAIELVRDGAPLTAAQHGEPVGQPVSLPLVHQSEPVGRLLVAPRPGEEQLSTTDQRLLAALATQVSATIKNIELDAELQRSRQRLVAAREEERRRLRRELHDGIGPTLAGSLLQLEAARASLPTDPARSEELLAKLEHETRQALSEVRRLARELRPPALDALGLTGALREQADHFSAGGDCEVTLVASDPLPRLPAAIEVAAYRIALEALSNVVRHAEAEHCRIAVVADDRLVLTVADDGRGIAPDASSGVGLRSMRERAAELGGTLAVRSGSGRGTVVEASLPLRGTSA